MTNAKQLFLRKPPEGSGQQSVSHWWASVVHDDRFAVVVTYVMADAFENGMNEQQAEGARRILSALKTLSDNEEGATKFPNPGLHHRFDAPKKLPEPPTTDKPAPDKKA